MLTLKDRFSSSGKTVEALVSIANIANTMDITLTEVGAWINVMGYFKGSDPQSQALSALAKGQARTLSVSVDAMMIWSAGAVKLDEYEAGVKAMQATTGR